MIKRINGNYERKFSIAMFGWFVSLFFFGLFLPFFVSVKKFCKVFFVIYFL